MKLIIGLGNPGEKYSRSRHNVGIMLIQFLKKNLESSDFKILESDEFMNNSGKFVEKQVNYFKIVPENLYVAHDDLDISLGEFKIQKGKGPKVHNGVNSVIDALGTDNFWRIRIGIDARDLEERIPGEEYVLQDFKEDELILIEKSFKEILKELQ